MGDRVAKSRARGASPAAQPSSSPLGCGARARLLWTTRIPTGDEARVRRLGLLDPPALLIAMALDIVSVSCASLAAFGFISRLQLQIDLKAHVTAFVTAYNFAKHLKALKWRTPYQVICEAWTQ